ncbi:MAG: aminotransferase class V-fold PLP-dependent enzyme [Sandaracinaceae bacterium]|nr:aminotransferase class V-fold PLP-dependent enzyme [Sandaracinaceae bacterium]
MREHWTLDPEITFLNHGSFGACPRAVLDRQSELRARLEREPVRFFVRELEPLLDEARGEVARFTGAAPEDVGFLRNATTGVNAVLRSIALAPGDELVTIDHAYNACRNVLDFVAARAGARVVVAKIPFPSDDPAQVLAAIERALTSRTKLALIEHVTSPTGLVLPIKAIARALEDRGVRVLVDGAHAPGMLPLELEKLGASWYVANFHKWTCAPKGAGMLWARRDRQSDLHPAVISHGYNSQRARKRWLEEMDWTGTDDPTPWLCVPYALRFIEQLLPGGWGAVRARNRALVLEGRRILCEALGLEAPAPESMIGALAALPLPDGGGGAPLSALYADPLQSALFDRHRIEVPVPPWPAPPKRLIRVSAFLHNTREDYLRLAAALRAELGLAPAPARPARDS